MATNKMNAHMFRTNFRKTHLYTYLATFMARSVTIPSSIFTR